MDTVTVTATDTDTGMLMDDICNLEGEEGGGMPGEMNGKQIESK